MTSEGVIRRTAPAKINLTLHLTGLRHDGYHLLESLVVFVDFGDALQAVPANELTLTVDGPFSNGVPTDGRNLMMQAANRLRDLRGVSAGAALHLTKMLPHGAGIGGGSSDAACALHMLAELWDVPVLSTDEALPLGADVPVCLRAPEATMMRGIGEDLSPASYQPKGWLVLVNPGAIVPTRTVFNRHDALYDFTPFELGTLEHVKDAEDFEKWLLRQRNDLTKVARENDIAPVIAVVLDALKRNSVGRDMSGSGSTCWGLFWTEAAAKTEANRIANAFPDWWVKATRIRS